ncbi:MAG: Selenide, water dikinase [Turneriella sp.]|nr:Selenide, water dikinase [Turneriella sp.]
MGTRLTTFSHGAGCGCKISPRLLEDILRDNVVAPTANVLVGNAEHDDAAAYLLGEGQVLLSTTDFFTPIVDKAYDFGRIAAANAISDIYAMGGRPILALAILGWPVDKLSTSLANEVIRGARDIAADCGITIAGGHSIDIPEPVFGLSVNGLVDTKHLKRNSTLEKGDVLLLTKPLGIGIHTTAMKQQKLKPEHEGLATQVMVHVNKVGALLGKEDAVHAITDVTGFGLAGHLLEMLTPRNLAARIDFNALPLLSGTREYLEEQIFPGGTTRNFKSFGGALEGVEDFFRRHVVCDPQTSGGLLVAVEPTKVDAVIKIIQRNDPKSPVAKIGCVTDFVGGARIHFT